MCTFLSFSRKIKYTRGIYHDSVTPRPADGSFILPLDRLFAPGRESAIIVHERCWSWWHALEKSTENSTIHKEIQFFFTASPIVGGWFGFFHRHPGVALRPGIFTRPQSLLLTSIPIVCLHRGRTHDSPWHGNWLLVALGKDNEIRLAHKGKSRCWQEGRELGRWCVCGRDDTKRSALTKTYE